MPIYNADELWIQLEENGEDEVRKKLAMGVYAADKIPLINEWLRRKEQERAQSKIVGKDNLYDKIIFKVKNNLASVILLVVFVIIVGIGTLTDSLGKIIAFVRNNSFHGAASRTVSPTTELNNQNFWQRIDIASKLKRSTERDTELKIIAEEALRKNDTFYALSATNLLPHSADKNILLKKIISCCVSAKDYGSANNIIDNLSDSRDREEARRKLLEAAKK